MNCRNSFHPVMPRNPLKHLCSIFLNSDPAAGYKGTYSTPRELEGEWAFLMGDVGDVNN